MPMRGLTSAHTSRVEALKSKHAVLSRKIEQEQGRASVSDMELRRMKQEKLFLKEQIEGVRGTA